MKFNARRKIRGRKALEESGLKISKKKTECIKFCYERKMEVRLHGEYSVSEKLTGNKEINEDIHQ